MRSEKALKPARDLVDTPQADQVQVHGLDAVLDQKRPRRHDRPVHISDGGRERIAQRVLAGDQLVRCGGDATDHG